MSNVLAAKKFCFNPAPVWQLVLSVSHSDVQMSIAVLLRLASKVGMAIGYTLSSSNFKWNERIIAACISNQVLIGIKS